MKKIFLDDNKPHGQNTKISATAEADGRCPGIVPKVDTEQRGGSSETRVSSSVSHPPLVTRLN
jgi:hypothetical protein